MSDCGGWYNVSKANLSPQSDVDWYRFSDEDNFGCTINPTVKFTSNPDAFTACIYFDCNSGEEDPDYSCSDGATKDSEGPESAPNGCCGDDEIVLGYNCTGTSSESATLYVKVFTADNTTCGGYELQLGDE